jgi:hypothetical protein
MPIKYAFVHTSTLHSYFPIRGTGRSILQVLSGEEKLNQFQIGLIFTYHLHYVYIYIS